METNMFMEHMKSQREHPKDPKCKETKWKDHCPICSVYAAHMCPIIRYTYPMLATTLQKEASGVTLLSQETCHLPDPHV